jgi:hypothetical protein
MNSLSAVFQSEPTPLSRTMSHNTVQAFRH